MDPNACYEIWRTAATATERRNAARDYNAWIDRGGFRAVACGRLDPTVAVVVDRLTPSRATIYRRYADGVIGARVQIDYRMAPAAGGAL